jgi:hypothetical protein
MSMVAIFTLSCCNRKVVSGRFKGDDMNHPTAAKCFYGCRPRTDLRGRPERFKLAFVEYLSEELVPPELMATWRFGHSTGNLWHKYSRAWLKRKEAQDQGAA